MEEFNPFVETTEQGPKKADKCRSSSFILPIVFHVSILVPCPCAWPTAQWSRCGDANSAGLPLGKTLNQCVTWRQPSIGV